MADGHVFMGGWEVRSRLSFRLADSDARPGKHSAMQTEHARCSTRLIETSAWEGDGKSGR